MFAERLKELRKGKNMTQVQLAEALGVSKGTIAMWEIGKREPNFETLNRLSDIFDKRIDYICVNEMYGIIEREIFSYGFRLGGRFMLETLTGLSFEE